VLAVPVAAPAARRELADVSDEFVAVLQPEDFQGVGQWYNDFTQVTDGEVTNLLQDSAADASG
jgi:putative phosphoribosyl transferase